MGIGFAIPAKLAQQVMMEIIQHGQVIRGWMGVEVRPTSGDFNADGSLNNKVSEGAFIAGVVRGGPAAGEGIEPGDVVTSIDGQKITDSGQFITRVGAIKPGTKVKLIVKRGNREIELAVTIGTRPKAEAASGPVEE
jgi:S1-C subfamily serine protease